MSDNVTYLPTKLDVPVARVLDGAAEQNLKHVVVVGVTEDNKIYLATSPGDQPLVNFMLDKAKQYWMED